MKIKSLSVTNFLKIRDLDVQLDEPIQLFCGSNEAGKSSLQEAIRYGLLGETARVSRKSDYGLMVRDGASEAGISVVTDTVSFHRKIKAKGQQEKDPEQELPIGLPYLLDATRYAWTDPKSRREFMFKLLGIKISPKLVGEKMLRRKVSQEMVDQVQPLLRAGFDAAAAEATKKASNARAEWKGITNETYGSEKAQVWEPPVEELDPEALQEAERNLKARTEQLEQALQRRGALLQTLGENKPAVEDKAEFDPPAGGTKKPVYPEGLNFNCPACNAKLNQHMGQIRVVTAEDLEADPFPATENKRPAKARKAPVKAPKPVVSAEAQELAELNQSIDQWRGHAQAAMADVSQLRGIQERQAMREETTARALTLAKQCEAWKQVADMLAPDGIPGEIITDQLKPLNDRLRATATITGWPQISVAADLELMVEGRPYSLQSESAQWRAQAAIAEAISALSGIGILVIDRMDVLDMNNRARLLKWVSAVTKDHNNIILFATLKAPPKLPEGFAVHWIDNGELSNAAAA